MKTKLIIIIFFSTTFLFCQTKFGEVKGKIVGLDTTSSLVGADILLIDIQTADSLSSNKHYEVKHPLLGAASGLMGSYEIKNIPLGKYIIRCAYVDYITQVDSIDLNENNTEIIKNFYLDPDPIKRTHKELKVH